MSDHPTPDSPLAWLQRARSDLALGRAALNIADVLPEDACFHAQQCVEKSLKAMLVAFNVPFPRTHVIEILLDLLATRVVLPPEVDKAFTLTQYAVETRYPGGWNPVSKDEAQDALETAEQVLRWVEQRIEKGA
jgi:HEPN domain-containing protein